MPWGVVGLGVGRSSFSISGIRNEFMVSLSYSARHSEFVFSTCTFLSVSSPTFWYRGPPFPTRDVL